MKKLSKKVARECGKYNLNKNDYSNLSLAIKKILQSTSD